VVGGGALKLLMRETSNRIPFPDGRNTKGAGGTLQKGPNHACMLSLARSQLPADTLWMWIVSPAATFWVMVSFETISANNEQRRPIMKVYFARVC
jgi:hypothetical protein